MFRTVDLSEAGAIEHWRICH